MMEVMILCINIANVASIPTLAIFTSRKGNYNKTCRAVPCSSLLFPAAAPFLLILMLLFYTYCD